MAHLENAMIRDTPSSVPRRGRPRDFGPGLDYSPPVPYTERSSGMRTIRGHVAVAGVGETDLLQARPGAGVRGELALRAILARLRGRGHRSAPGRRLRLVQQRPQRSLAAGRGARPARAALLEHAVGRRRRRRLGGGGQRGGGGRRRLRRLRGGLPRARAGAVPALRRRAAGGDGRPARPRSPSRTGSSRRPSASPCG